MFVEEALLRIETIQFIRAIIFYDIFEYSMADADFN